MKPETKSRDVYIVDGARTPFLKVRGSRGPFSALDLATAASRALLMRLPIEPTQIDEVILGCIMPSQDEANIGRLLALRAGCGDKVPGWTVQRNCASGMQSIACAMKNIADGESQVVLAGGTEAMSRAPLILRPELFNWLAELRAARSTWKKIALLHKLRPHFFKPIVALICGLTDPIVGLNMGQTAEILAADFGITRAEMDAFSAESHQRVAKAYQDKHYDEVIPIYDAKGHVYQSDDGFRSDSTPEILGKLKPAFERPFGLVTAGNSSQITDGAAVVLLASGDAVQKYQLPVLAKVKAVAWAALDPRRMGLGPAYATAKLLQQEKLQMSDIDYWEINEAFAAQVLACNDALKSDAFCQKELGLSKALGAFDFSRVNVDGGAIALGHPVGASGARIVLHLAKVLQRKKARLGVATICIGGGQGGAMLIERVGE